MRVPEPTRKEGSRIDQHFEKLTNYADGSRPSFLQKAYGEAIDLTLYDIDKAKDFLQLARDATIDGNWLQALKMLDQVMFHRDNARKTLLKATKIEAAE